MPRLIFILSIVFSLPLKALSVKSDVAAALSPFICKNQKIDLSTLTNLKIYDAQISAKVLSRADFGTLTEVELKQIASIWADSNQHAGISFGQCSDKSSWVASMPSAKSVVVKKDRIVLPQLKDECLKVAVDFAPVAAKPGKSLMVQNDQILLKGLEPGFVSISCLPKLAKKIGPRLIFLVPIHNPRIDSLINANVGDFLSAIRKTVLIEVKSGELAEMAEALAAKQSLDHDRILLAKLAKNAKEYSLIGENRGSGSNLSQVLQLMWLSARHRRLLLDPKATHFAYAMHQQGSEVFVVLVFASRKDSH